MLGNHNVAEAIAFKVIEPAGRLYEGAPGTELVRTEESVGRGCKRGISRVRIAESSYARSGESTSATWAVGDEIDTMLQALKGF